MSNLFNQDPQCDVLFSDPDHSNVGNIRFSSFHIQIFIKFVVLWYQNDLIL